MGKLGFGEKLSTAKGAYQFLEDSIQPAYNRLARFEEVSEYDEVLEHKDASKLEPILQDLLITAALTEKPIRNKEGKAGLEYVLALNIYPMRGGRKDKKLHALILENMSIPIFNRIINRIHAEYGNDGAEYTFNKDSWSPSYTQD